MTSEGVLCEDCLAFDPPKQNSWEAKAGTQLLCENNLVPELIKVTLAASSPPSGTTETVGPIYEINAYTSKNSMIPSPINISPLFRMALAYDPNELPTNTSEVILAYSYEPSQGWLEMTPDIGTVAEIGKTRGTLDYFTPNTLLAKLAGLTPAGFVASDLAISPSQTQLNQKVTISVKVTNTSGTSIDYIIQLRVDGIVKSSKLVSLADGASQIVNFTVTSDTIGKHLVQVAGLKGEFMVVGPPKINVGLIAGIIGVILLIITGLLIWRRQLAD